VLTILDHLDTRFMNDSELCTKTRYYQSLDKISDEFAYLFVLLIIKNDWLLSILVYYRLIGVIKFVQTDNTDFLILMPDVVKEYLLYRYFFDTNQYFVFVFIAKVIFEYIFHKKHNIRARWNMYKSNDPLTKYE